MASSVEKPRVLILGGVGFIGRNLVEYLITNDLTSKIRVADKVPPKTAWMNPKHLEVFSKVEYQSANLINQASCERCYHDDEGEYDIVVNLAAETKYGQSEPVYKDGIVKLSLNCAREAAKRKVKLFIEVSTGQVYSADKKASCEMSKTSPWTHLAKHKLEVEKELSKIEGLNFIIVRPAIVYGMGDKTGLLPRLVIAAVYKQIRETMKLLWTKDLKMNTVHVGDMCRAIWHLTREGKVGEVYNIVDNSHTTQGLITEIVSKIFGIEYDYMGSIISNIAKITMTDVVDESNDKHMTPWSKACESDNIHNTPLSPFIDQELLYNKHLHMDSSKLINTGFTYEKPILTQDYLQEVLDDYVSMGVFPTSLVQTSA
ncbi:dTDP-glucose 4,6-dehydratase-like [Glandiceps talaboti]